MKNQTGKGLNVAVRVFFSRPSLREIYKNAVRCSARHRLFCIFHSNSTLLDNACNVKTLMREVF